MPLGRQPPDAAQRRARRPLGVVYAWASSSQRPPGEASGTCLSSPTASPASSSNSPLDAFRVQRPSSSWNSASRGQPMRLTLAARRAASGTAAPSLSHAARCRQSQLLRAAAPAQSLLRAAVCQLVRTRWRLAARQGTRACAAAPATSASQDPGGSTTLGMRQAQHTCS
jgi:hypothetical protein